MPELPDVEGFRRELARRAEGRRIVRVDMPDTAPQRRRRLYDALRVARLGRPAVPRPYDVALCAHATPVCDRAG